MPAPVSRGRGRSNEITHLVPIRSGEIPGAHIPGLRYADRLRTALEFFHATADRNAPNAIRHLRVVHYAQWTLIDQDTRLFLNVVFDGDWYDYLRVLAEEIPGTLNLIWSNCEGWESVAGHPEVFFEFVRRYQLRVGYFYTQYEDLTVRDIEWHKTLATLSEGVPHLDRETLHEQLASRMRPQSSGQRRMEALGAIPPAALARQKQAFTATLQPLYSPAEFALAFTEVFG